MPELWRTSAELLATNVPPPLNVIRYSAVHEILGVPAFEIVAFAVMLFDMMKGAHHIAEAARCEVPTEFDGGGDTRSIGSPRCQGDDVSRLALDERGYMLRPLVERVALLVEILKFVVHVLNGVAAENVI